MPWGFLSPFLSQQHRTANHASAGEVVVAPLIRVKRGQEGGRLLYPRLFTPSLSRNSSCGSASLASGRRSAPTFRPSAPTPPNSFSSRRRSARSVTVRRRRYRYCRRGTVRATWLGLEGVRVTWLDPPGVRPTFQTIVLPAGTSMVRMYEP
jgi:hypothetical protein